MIFDSIIGTGGIGTGILFELDGDRPLSRNETRLARLSPTHDYCKQHIILHYLARLLSPEVSVRPIGLVGRDDAGDRLIAQMREAGMDVSLVGQTAERPTMYCVCMQYPDKAVCNVTTSESACSMVDVAYTRDALSRLIPPIDDHTLALAVPEVPLEARLELLRQAKTAGAYCVASCLVDEFPGFAAGEGYRLTDLLVINEDEAAACCGSRETNMEALARACHAVLKRQNPSIRLAMTCGAAGSYVCEEDSVALVPALPARVVATGGAGDAYTAGTIYGLAMGLPFLPGQGLCAPMLGAFLAAESIAEADTIAGHIDRALTQNWLEQHHANERRQST